MFTPAEASKPLEPAIMQGRHFDSCTNMERTLGALIHHAVWNEQWSNTEHDHDRLASIMYFLIWQNGMPRGRKPFSGRNLYALLYMGGFAGLLQASGGRYTLSATSQNLISRVKSLAASMFTELPVIDQDEFLSFCQEYNEFHSSEVKRRDTAENGEPHGVQKPDNAASPTVTVSRDLQVTQYDDDTDMEDLGEADVEDEDGIP